MQLEFLVVAPGMFREIVTVSHDLTQSFGVCNWSCDDFKYSRLKFTPLG